jgi:lipid-binding SYLF domain-containing protein
MRVEQDIAFDELEIQHPNIREKANAAHAYAIFPRVAKGAFGVGGARGDGLVYEGSKQIGTAVLTQASIGAQIGGSTFRQLIIFEDERALRRFIGGRLEFSARAQATAGEGGGAGDISYEDGVAVYTVSAGGLMLDASIGGQDFEFFWHRDRSTIPAD